MAYAEDVMTLARLEKYRLVGIVLGVSLTFVSLLAGMSLSLPRFVVWAAVAGICFLEGRVVKRLGRDAMGCWLRVAVCAIVAAIHLI